MVLLPRPVGSSLAHDNPGATHSVTLHPSIKDWPIPLLLKVWPIPLLYIHLIPLLLKVWPIPLLLKVWSIPLLYIHLSWPGPFRYS